MEQIEKCPRCGGSCIARGFRRSTREEERDNPNGILEVFCNNCGYKN